MSGSFGSSRRSRSRSPIDDYAKKSLLAKVNKSELKLLRVAVRRNDVIGGGPSLPLERNIDDPVKICAYVHYRKELPGEYRRQRECHYESKMPQPPIFGRGIKVNQDFTENRRVFTHEKNDKDRRKSRSRSSYRSRSPRNRARSRERTKSQDRNRYERSRRSRSKDRSDNNIRNRNTSRRSLSKHRSRSKERRYSSERRKYRDEPSSSQKSRYSRSRSRSHDHEPNCPMYRRKKSLTPLRPGEYRPGHPDLAFRNKREKSRSRSRSYDKSRSPTRSDKYGRRGKSPYNQHSPTKRSYKSDRSRSPKKQTRSPQYGELMHADYGYYEGWPPGPRLPAGRGGFPMQPYYPAAYHPRNLIPGPLIPPGHMIVPRIPIIPPLYGQYRPHLPNYNSGAVRQRGPRPNVKPSTVTSGTYKDGNSEDSRVVITEITGRDSEKDESTGNLVDKNSEQGKKDSEKTD